VLEDSCALLGCNNPFHDHAPAAGLPELAKLLDAADPAFERITALLVDMQRAGISPTRETVAVAIKLGRLYHSSAEPVPAPVEVYETLRHDVVYYMRFGNLIKIGTSGVLQTRVRVLKPDELLATEPGSYRLERKRHRQFSRYRAEGEFFYPAPELLEHIRKVKAQQRRPKPRAAAAPGSGQDLAKLGEHLF
jgi:hypothetical protein